MTELYVWTEPGNKGIIFTCSQKKHSAFEVIEKGVFLLFIICKCRGNKFWLEREKSGILIHGESTWKLFKIKTSSLKIRLKGSEKLKRERKYSILFLPYIVILHIIFFRKIVFWNSNVGMFIVFGIFFKRAFLYTAHIVFLR